ncbi:MAG: hypothetical protein SFV51_20085 [Bryobacteraceae bacterium]|nr:hypothetical protein [Bryobacteraceae bacterium]
MAKARNKPKPSMDAVIEVYKQGIDRTLLRENLKLTGEERILRAQDSLEFVRQFRGIARRRTKTDGK